MAVAVPGSSARSIVPRALGARAAPLPRHWHGGDPVRTHFFDALSLIFPLGERYFARAVAHYRKRITDPLLAEQVAGFLAQEARHDREHGRYNEQLQAHGYDTDALSARFARNVELTRRLRSPLAQLSHAVAVEHLTATFGHVLLSQPAWLEGVEPAHQRIWRWHALEEVEHKAVAFDVYRAVGGGYFLRVMAMLEVTLMFPLVMSVLVLSLLRADGLLRAPRTWLAMLRFLFTRPGLVPGVLGGYLAFFRPGFHPWQRDDSALLATQEALLRAEPGPGA
jgi:predicted metal-dependent hydrolase